jgi:hypothetical protein
MKLRVDPITGVLDIDCRRIVIIALVQKVHIVFEHRLSVVRKVIVNL